jgi:hypothetical protein
MGVISPGLEADIGGVAPDGLKRRQYVAENIRYIRRTNNTLDAAIAPGSV